MKISLQKFGTLLTTREAGREALAAFQPILKEYRKGTPIEIDFAGVSTFTPSWGDEFLRPLHTLAGSNLTLKNTENPSVKLSLDILEEANHMTWKRV